MIHQANLYFPKEMIRKYQTRMDQAPDYASLGIKTHATIATWSVTFPDGYSMSIRVMSRGKNMKFVSDAALINEADAEIAITADKDQLQGEYRLVHGADIYHVNILETPMGKTFLAMRTTGGDTLKYDTLTEKLYDTDGTVLTASKTMPSRKERTRTHNRKDASPSPTWRDYDGKSCMYMPGFDLALTKQDGLWICTLETNTSSDVPALSGIIKKWIAMFDDDTDDLAGMKRNALEWATDIVKNAMDAMSVACKYLDFAKEYPAHAPAEPAVSDKHVIWSNMDDFSDSEIEDMIFAHLDEPGEYTKQDAYQDLVMQRDDWLEDEKSNLKAGTLGLWNGKRKVARLFPNAELDDIFNVDMYEACEFYAKDGEIQCDVHHHDGTNHFVFRKVTADVDTICDACDELNNSGTSDERVDVLVKDTTESLYPDIARIYGWTD